MFSPLSPSSFFLPPLLPPISSRASENCAPVASEDLGECAEFVTPLNTSDRKRPPAEQIVKSYGQRTEGEENKNDMHEKMDAMKAMNGN